MKRTLLLLTAVSFAFFAGCAGCGTKAELLDHEPTVQELKEVIKLAYVDVNKTNELSDAMADRLIGPKVAWATLSKVERERHMARTVMPVMLTLFQSFDQRSNDNDFDNDFNREFRGGFGPGQSLSGSFNCFTCHGETFVKDVANFDFARPTHLYPLDPNNLPTEANPGKSSARMIRFMTYTVTPAMRILLGRPDANCFTCHQVKK